MALEANPTLQAPPVANAASLVQITAEEYHRLRGLEPQLIEFRTKAQADLEAKEQDRIKAIAEKGEIQKALEEQRKLGESKLAEATTNFTKVRELYHGKAKSATIAAALTGRQFAGDKPEVQAVAAAQFRTLIEPLFETVEAENGDVVVREKVSGRPAADALKELLNAPTYQHFFAPSSRGGSGTDGTLSTSTPGSQQSDNPHQPGSVAWYAHNFERNNVASTGLIMKRP